MANDSRGGEERPRLRPSSGRAFTEARLGTSPNPALVTHALRPRLLAEARTLEAHLSVELAHCVMLAKTAILTRLQAKQIADALVALRNDGAGALQMDPVHGSLLLQIERFIADRANDDVAGRLHIGRSRNDLSAAVNRIMARNGLLNVMVALLRLQDELLSLAREHATTLMPGYTHLQHAQPTTFGHYLLRHYFTFERDQERLQGAYLRTNLSSLGGAAMVGTSWNVDRSLVAHLLGHEGLVEHATDAGIFARDYPAEIAAVLSILISDIGRVAGDFYLWSTWEFDFLEVADDMAGTSSIMPQKKNPQALERIKGLAGAAIGWLPTVLGTLRSASSSDLDLHFAPDPTQEMATASTAAAELLTATIHGIQVNTDTMRQRTNKNWTTASNLADTLVRHAGLSFRAAHAVVGRLVRKAIAAGVDPDEVGTALLDEAALEAIGRKVDLPKESIANALDPKAFLESLLTEGSASSAAIQSMLEAASVRQEQHAQWLAGKRDLIERGAQQLEAELHAIAG